MSNLSGNAKIPDIALLTKRIKSLLPKGSAWFFLDIGDKLLRAFSATDQQLLIDINALQNDMLPQTTVDLREEWQKSVSLPDECITILPNDNFEILNRIRARGSESVEDYQAQFPDATIIEVFVNIIDEVETDFELIDDELWQHTWILQIAAVDLNEPQAQFICRVQKEFSAHHQVIIDII